jgi:nitrite reductase/ring-hydroxylating ferredoxin subunit/predicted secreted protein
LASEPADAELVRALPSEECPLGTPQEPELRKVRVGDSEMILCRLSDGQVVAFGTRCPHQGTDLMEASFFDDRLRCPHHLYLYDPRTGENVIPSHDARPENLWKLKPGYLPTYRVEERDGWIWVAERASPPPPGYDPAREQRPVGARPAEAAPGVAAGAGRPAGETGAAGPVEHPTKTLRVRVGAGFELRLPMPPRPGHVWRVEASRGLLSVVQERYDPTADPPRHRVNLVARHEGVATVRCAFGRPWDATPAEVRTYVVRIEG